MQDALRCTGAHDFTRAYRHLSEAMRLSPMSAAPHFLLAANFAQQGNAQEAEAQFIQCLSRDPSYEIARFQLGLLQLTNGRASVALATWEPLLGASDETYLKRFAQGFQEVLLGNRASAERFIRDGIARNADLPQLNQDMEAVLLRLNAMPMVQESPRAMEPVVEAQETSHFLVGAYRQG